jgi:hypothetical protein
MGLFEGDIAARLYRQATPLDAMAVEFPPDTPANSEVAVCPHKTNTDACPTQGVGCAHTRDGPCGTEQCTPGVTMKPGHCPKD